MPASTEKTCSASPRPIPVSTPRSYLGASSAKGLLFDTLLNLRRERGRQRTDATRVPGAVRSLNRLGHAIETLRTAPHWLRAHADPVWVEHPEASRHGCAKSRPAFAADRRRQAGIEETLSRGVRAMGVRRSRYPGLAKTHMRRVLTATAINLGRLAAWIDDAPTARTRRSPSTAAIDRPKARRRLETWPNSCVGHPHQSKLVPA